MTISLELPVDDFSKPGIKFCLSISCNGPFGTIYGERLFSVQGLLSAPESFYCCFPDDSEVHFSQHAEMDDVHHYSCELLEEWFEDVGFTLQSATERIIEMGATIVLKGNQ